MIDATDIESALFKFSNACKRLGVHRIPGAKSVHSLLYVGFADRVDVVDRADITEQHGFELVAPPIMFPGEESSESYEPDVTSALMSLTEPGDTVLDIGGYIGYHTLVLRSAVGDQGTVITFEPHPDNVALIEETIARNGLENVSVEPVAVSGSTGTTTLAAHPKANSMHSLIPVHDGTRSITVDTTVLSEYLSQEGIPKVDVAKIDVEGSEKSIICDTDALEYIRRAVIELHPQFIGGEDAKEAFRELDHRGKVTGIDGGDIELDQLDLASTNRLVWYSESSLN